MTKGEREAIVAAGRLAISVTKFLRGKDDAEKIDGFTSMAVALDEYDRKVIALMHAEPVARRKKS